MYKKELLNHQWVIFRYGVAMSMRTIAAVKMVFLIKLKIIIF